MNTEGTTDYHLGELEVVLRADDPRRCVPDVECTGRDVLDVGCGIGQTLMAPEFASAASRHGVDIDAAAVRTGRQMFPGLKLVVASAERLPYPDGQFGLVFSRVAIPYTNVPVALAEMVRVARPDGTIWLAVHTWRTERHELARALRGLRLRRLIDRLYVLVNSAVLAAFGVCFARPWSGTYESFQCRRPMVRLLKGMSAEGIRWWREKPGVYCMSARKPAPVEFHDASGGH